MMDVWVDERVAGLSLALRTMMPHCLCQLAVTIPGSTNLTCATTESPFRRPPDRRLTELADQGPRADLCRFSHLTLIASSHSPKSAIRG